MNLKIAVAQIATDPGDILSNTRKIISHINQAKKEGANIIIFPELAIPGYMSLDLMLHDKFIKDNLKALNQIKQQTHGILVVVGFISQHPKKIGPDNTKIRYNSAAVLYNRKILACVNKTLLPDYDVFFENRYFSQSENREVVNFKGLKFGIQICEDLWDENYPTKVSEDLVNKGADILINISGSPFYIGKRFDRLRVIQKIIRNYSTPFIYVNTVGCQDGYDGELVFDGQSMVFNKIGKLQYLGKQFEEEMFFIHTDDLFDASKGKLKLSIYNETEELFNALVLAIKDYFRRSNFKKAFIGLSGGIDSAVVAVLTAKALGKDNVTGIFMPSSYTSKNSLDDSLKLAKNLGIGFEKLSIKKPFMDFTTLLRNAFSNMPADETEENIQARIRGIILMAYANKFNGLVISTANKTETALGYTTLYGDMCGAIAPLSDISKLKVYSMANYINGSDLIIPQEIIDKIPTAELRENQTDEASLGASYSVISPLVDEIVEDSKTIRQLEKKYPGKIVKKIADLINKSEYKRRQASPGIKVTKKSFGLGRRVPIAHKFQN